MKLTFFTVIYIFLFLTPGNEFKLNLLCQKWRQVGIKHFGKEYKPVDSTMAEVILIKNNGLYEEELYGSIQIKGQWKFSSDSSKLAFAVTEFNGTVTPNLTLDETIPRDSIIKLTKDTLIYGAIAFNGKDKIYGHDDKYYVREK